MSAAQLIDRLQRVRQTGPGRWIASCPAHEDRSPSLSIRELDDGRVLLHDFGGCGTDDILAAVGLTMAALFPARLPGYGYAPTHSRTPARDLLDLIAMETTVVYLTALDLRNGRTISDEGWRRFCEAASRIQAARAEAFRVR